MLVTAEGLADKFTHGAVFFFGVGKRLLVESGGKADGEDFGGEHNTIYVGVWLKLHAGALLGAPSIE